MNESFTEVTYQIFTLFTLGRLKTTALECHDLDIVSPQNVEGLVAGGLDAVKRSDLRPLRCGFERPHLRFVGVWSCHLTLLVSNCSLEGVALHGGLSYSDSIVGEW